MGNQDKRDVSIASTLREFVRDEVRGIYTASVGIVEDVDSENRRVEVSLKSDPNVFVDNVPIASGFADDDAGVIMPIERDMEGLLVHTREPLSAKLQERGPVETNSRRRFELESAVFIAGLWLDDMDVPEHTDGEFLIAMPGDGSVLTMDQDGGFHVEHSSGNVIQMDSDGTITLGDPDSAAPVLTTDASLTDSEGGSVTINSPGSEDTNAS